MIVTAPELGLVSPKGKLTAERNLLTCLYCTKNLTSSEIGIVSPRGPAPGAGVRRTVL